MLAQRVTSLAAWTGASQLISCRLIGYFLRVCLCLCRLPLTMPRGYRLLRFVHRAAHAVALVLFDKHPRTQGGLNQTCISFRVFFSETKCQGWSRGRGRGERAHWFNKRREDRWCSTTTKKYTDEKDYKKVIRVRKACIRGRESPWWKVFMHRSCQISHPENIFKCNRNSNKWQSPNVGNCHYPDLSL